MLRSQSAGARVLAGALWGSFSPRGSTLGRVSEDHVTSPPLRNGKERGGFRDRGLSQKQTTFAVVCHGTRCLNSKDSEHHESRATGISFISQPAPGRVVLNMAFT
ncbi:hypothetical protein MRX96_036889 [Rhipicephalus microplus]